MCWIPLSSKMNLGTKWASQHLQRALTSLTPSTHPFLLLLGVLFNFSEFLNHPRLWALKTLIIDHLEELFPKALLKLYLLTVTSCHYLWNTESSVRSTPTLGPVDGWVLLRQAAEQGTLSSMAVMKPVCCVWLWIPHCETHSQGLLSAFLSLTHLASCCSCS